MSRAVLNAFAVVALLTVAAGCATEDDSDGYRQSATGPAQADIDDEPPYGPGVEVGKTYDYVLYTHCGIEWARLDGVWWHANPLNDGNANPPPGWGNPYDAGELQVLDDRTATYRGGPDAEVQFERTATVEAPFACE